MIEKATPARDPAPLQATLAASDGQEQAAAARLQEGEAAMRQMLQAAAPVAEAAVRAVQECQAWQVGGRAGR